MSQGGDIGSAGRTALAPLVVVLALILLLGLFPPETNGQSQAGCAALVLLLAILGRSDAAPATGEWGLVLALLVAPLLSRAAFAPGASVEPLSIAILAAAAGIYAARHARPLAGERKIPIALSTVGGALGGLALYEKLWGLRDLAARVEALPSLPDQALVLARLHEGRAYGPFATPAALGCFLAFALPVTFALALERRGRVRVLLVALVLLQAGGIVASASATAAGSLVAAALLAVSGRRGRRRSFWLAAMVALALLGAVVLARGNHIISPLDAESPWKLRAGNFRVACEIVRDHPWLGVGPGGFGEVFPQYRREGDNESQHVHDLPLELAAEIGVPLALLLTPFFFLVFLGRSLSSRSPDAPGWHSGVAIGLAAFAIQNLADFTAFFPSTLWAASLLWGVTYSPPSRALERGAPSRSLSSIALAGTVLAALLAALSGLAANARVGARNAVAVGDHAEAAALARRAVRFAAWDEDCRMLKAQTILEDPTRPTEEDSKLERALHEAERAVSQAPIRPAARELRSRIRFALGDTPGGYADLAEAARLYPLRAEYVARMEAARQHLPAPPPEERRP